VVIEDNGKQNNNNGRHRERQLGDLKETSLSSQKIWENVSKNYEMIEGAQLSNSFILLMALSNAKKPLNTTQISELISFYSKGRIYKISATLKDALEHRLKRKGYVEGIDEKNRSLYSITPKGKKLLKGWIAFISAYS
jgi:predicted transcriptional regulator